MRSRVWRQGGHRRHRAVDKGLDRRCPSTGAASRGLAASHWRRVVLPCGRDDRNRGRNRVPATRAGGRPRVPGVRRRARASLRQPARRLNSRCGSCSTSSSRTPSRPCWQRSSPVHCTCERSQGAVHQMFSDCSAHWPATSGGFRFALQRLVEVPVCLQAHPELRLTDRRPGRCPRASTRAPTGHGRRERTPEPPSRGSGRGAFGPHAGAWRLPARAHSPPGRASRWP